MLGFNDAWRHEHKARIFDLGPDFAYCGATVIRYPWVWDTETDRELHDGIKEAKAAGLKPILCPYSYQNEAGRIGELSEFFVELADRYPGLPIEVLNEPNIPVYGKHTASEYATIFREAHAAIRSAGKPDRKILASGGAWWPYQKDSYWLRDFLDATEDLDYIVSAHFYMGQGTSLTPEQAVQNLAILYRRHCPERTLWCTETGYPAGTFGAIVSSESRQAAMLGRLVAEIKRQGIERVCVHRLYDYFVDDTVLWGVKRRDGTWKPAAAAIKEG